MIVTSGQIALRHLAAAIAAVPAAAAGVRADRELLPRSFVCKCRSIG